MASGSGTGWLGGGLGSTVINPTSPPGFLFLCPTSGRNADGSLNGAAAAQRLYSVPYSSPAEAMSVEHQILMFPWTYPYGAGGMRAKSKNERRIVSHSHHTKIRLEGPTSHFR